MEGLENIKPTVKTPVSQQSINFEKNFKKTMRDNKLNINEYDELLTEKELSLKRKIFSLPKMEALVFSDPKLTKIYDKMAADGEEKYGYHYNETIMNIIFNDYVLNSPEYLQKYKMAIPKRKKRRDVVGIKQLKRELSPKEKKKNDMERKNLGEETDNVSSENEGNDIENKVDYDNDCIIESNGFKYSVSCAGKFIGEFDTIGDALRSVKAWKQSNKWFPTTWYISDHGNPYIIDDEGNIINETTTAGSAGGAAGYVGYATPYAWGSGDLMKGKTSKVVRKPIWKGGSIIKESNYLTDDFGFKNFLKTLEEGKNLDVSFYSELGEQYQKEKIGSNKGLGVTEQPQDNKREKLKSEIDKNSMLYVGQDVDKMKDKDVEILYNDMTKNNTMFPHPDNPNLKDDGIAGEKSDIKIKHRNLVDDFVINKTTAFTSDTIKKWNDEDMEVELETIIDKKLDESNSDLIEFIVPEWSLNALINDDYSGLDDEDKEKLAKFINDVIKKYGNDNFIVGDIEGVDNLGFSKSNDIDNLGDNVYRIYLKPTKQISKEDTYNSNQINSDMKQDEIFEQKDGELDEGCGGKKKGVAKSKAQQQAAGIAYAAKEGDVPKSELKGASKEMYKSMTKKELKKFASTKHKGLPEKVDEGIFGFGKKERTPTPTSIILDYLKSKYNISHEMYKNILDKNYYLDTKFGGFSENKLKKIAEKIYSSMQSNLKEESQTMIGDNPTTMANKPSPVGSQFTGIDSGTKTSGGIKEEFKNENVDNLLSEIDNELKAFSLHHEKLLKISEMRKPSALVLRDRLGAQNEKNFKSDVSKSNTNKVINLEKELQWKDQQTTIKDPKELSKKIEEKEIEVTDAKGDEFLKNVGNSTNDKGDEIPKRNLTDEEQSEVNMMRLGQHSLIYDNEPDKRFEERMKADMGEKFYKIRQDQMKYRSKAPMYNKDSQPTTKGNDVYQYDKETSTWNKRVGIDENFIISGKYYDELGRKQIISFNSEDINTSINESKLDDLFEIILEGMGNKYSSDFMLNKKIEDIVDQYKFYTDKTNVFAIKKKEEVNENKENKKVLVDENYKKMKHLINYNPKDFIDTSDIKRKRGF